MKHFLFYLDYNHSNNDNGKLTQVPQEWQSSAFSQHTASWGCAYLAAPALIAWSRDSADRILTLATSTMILSAAIVEITFVDTRPEGCRSQRMRDVVGGYIIDGARDLAEVGKKVSGVDLAEYFNAGREKEALLPSPPPVTVGDGEVNGDGLGAAAEWSFADTLRANSAGEGDLRHRRRGGGEGRPAWVALGVNEDSASISSGTNGSFQAAGSSEGSVGRPPEGKGLNGELSAAKSKSGGESEKGLGLERMSSRALVGVFRGMMRERLVLVTSVLQAIRPAQDLAPLVTLKFSGGASVLAGIRSSRSLCRVLVPMTPLIPWLVRLAGGSSGEGAAAKMSGDRAVAAFMCVVMAGLVVCIPAVETLQELHHLMAFNGLCHIVRASTVGAVMSRSAGKASAGAFFGWQHCIKGFQGTFSNFLTGWLSGYSIALPYYVVAICDLLYAFTYLYI